MDKKTVFCWKQFSTDSAKDFCKYYKSRKFSDIKLCLDNGDIFHAHQIFLANASSYFHRILNNGQEYGPRVGEPIVFFFAFRSIKLLCQKNNLQTEYFFTVCLPETRSDAMSDILELIYFGVVHVKSADANAFVQIAHRFGIRGFRETSIDESIRVLSQSMLDDRGKQSLRHIISIDQTKEAAYEQGGGEIQYMDQTNSDARQNEIIEGFENQEIQIIDCDSGSCCSPAYTVLDKSSSDNDF